MNTALAWVMSHDADIRRVIALNLCKRGMRCVEVSGPRGECEAGATTPQVIILDIDPAAGLDWEAARSLRRVPGLQDVPLVVIGAAMLPASQLAGLRPVYAVHKPLALDELLARVRQSLAHVGASDEGGKGACGEKRMNVDRRPPGVGGKIPQVSEIT